MTSAFTTENNINLKDIIGELSPYYEEKPDEIIKLGPGIRINIDPSGECKIYYTQTNEWRYFPGKTKISMDEETAKIFYCRKYFCSLSNSICEKEFNVYNSYILDEYSLSCDYYQSYKQISYNKKIPIIGLYSNYNMICFIFNFRDLRKSYSLALNLMKEKMLLPDELVDVISTEYLGCVEPKDKYNPCDFPQEFECKYAEEAPKKFSPAQLLKLYELGIIKIVKAMQKEKTLMNGLHFYTEYYILSDEAFDNPDNVLKNFFQTKEKMHEYIQEGLNQYFSDELIPVGYTHN